MWTMGLNNSNDTKKNKAIFWNAFRSKSSTVIVSAEFLVLACASNLHLAHRLTPPALAVAVCNIGAR